VVRRQLLRDHEQAALAWIDRAAAPVRAAVVPRHLDRSLQARRREQTFVARALEQLANRRLVLLGDVRVHVLLRERLARERRRRGRERLRRPALLTRNV